MTRIVVSALRAERFFASGWIVLRKLALNVAAPALVLVQTEEDVARFTELGCHTEMLPNGVDTLRFSPVSETEKKRLRRKYKIDPERPVVLHVGHLQSARNLEILIPLINRQIQVVVAGSLYMGIHQELIQTLEKAGFLLFKGYQPYIEELYRLADVYVFPLEPGNSLSMPLSVLEAMSTNLRVVSTRFPGLVSSFQEGMGLRFVASSDQVVEEVMRQLGESVTVSTREQVSSFSWDAISNQLMDFYQICLQVDKTL